VGGKVNTGEDILAAVTREAREEVGFNLGGANLIVTHVETGPDYNVVWVVACVPEKQEPIVPVSEAEKITAPRWLPVQEVDTTTMHPKTAESYRASTPFFNSGTSATTSGASAPAEGGWLRRGASADLPGDNFFLTLINNKDGLCVPRAITAVSGQEFDLDDLAARVPDEGYDYRTLVSDPTSWALWDADLRRWTVGDPERATFFLFRKMNGKFGHIDGLRRETDPARCCDMVYHPQGRAGDDPVCDAFVQYANSSIAGIIEPAARIDLYRAAVERCLALEGDERTQWIEQFYKVGVVDTKGKAAETPPLTPPPFNTAPVTAELPNVATPDDQLLVPPFQLNYGGNTEPNIKNPVTGKASNVISAPLTLSGSLDMIQVTEDRRAQTIELDDRTLLFRETQLERPVTFSSATDGLNNLGRLMLDDAIPHTTDVTFTSANGSGCVLYQYRDDANSFMAREYFAFTGGRNTHSQVFERNIVLGNYADQFSKTEKEYARLYNYLFPSTQASARFADWLTKTDEVPGVSFAEHWERLWSGMLATHTQCVRANVIRNVNGHGAGTADPHYLAVFPNSAAFEDVLGLSGNAVAGWPSLTADQGRSMSTIIPLRTFGDIRVPPVAVGRDFRAVLYHFTRPHLDLQGPLTMHPAGQPRTRAHLANTNAFISRFTADIPPLVFMTDDLRLASNATAAYNAAALENPESWRDAIVFLLQMIGGSASCMLGFERCVRRSFYFYPAEVAHLPSSLEERFTIGRDLIEVTRRRLAYMRIIQPDLDAGNPPAVRNDPHTSHFFRLLCSSDVPGHPLNRAALAANVAAPGWQTINDIFGAGQVIGNLPAASHTGLLVPSEYATVHGTWHQYFSQVSLDGPGSPILRDFLAVMPQADLESLTHYLCDGFLNGFAPGAAYPAAWPANTIALATRGGVAVPNTRDRARYLSAGGILRNDHLLPITNLVERYTALPPSGVNAVRDIKTSTNIFHEDTVAFSLARRIAQAGQLPIAGVFARAALMAVQMRAGIDAAASEMQLNASTLQLRTGVPVTGVPAIDDILHRTNEYVNFGSARDFLTTYARGACHSLLNAGYPDTLGAEVGTSIRLELPSLDAWGYTRLVNPLLPNGPEFDTPNAPLHIWRSFHHLTVNFFRPDCSLPGGTPAKTMQVFSYFTPGAELPWDNWAISTAAFKRFDAYGALRILASANGYVFTAKPSIPFARTYGNRTRVDYHVLLDLARRGPRYGLFGRTSPAVKVEPLWYYASGLTPNLITDVDAFGNADFMSPSPVFEYHSTPRLTSVAPLFNYDRSNVQRFADANQLNTANVGWINRVCPEDRYSIYPGMDSQGSRHHMWSVNADATGINNNCLPFFSRQQSANPSFQRSPIAAVRSHPAYRLYDTSAGPPAPYIGANGNPMPANYFAGQAATANMSTDRRRALFTMVAYGGNMPPPGPGAQLTYMYTLINSWLQRFAQWYIKPTMYLPPVYLSGRYEVPVFHFSDLEGTVSSTRQRFVPPEGLSRAIGGFEARFEPAENTRRTILNFDPDIVAVPFTRAMDEHLITGFQSMLSPIMDYNGTAHNAGVRAKALETRRDALTLELEQLATQKDFS
jgi:hypothetical protein